MGMIISLIVIAAGAILRWAVTATAKGIDLDVVGLILLVVGLIGFVLSLVAWMEWWDWRDRWRTRPPRRVGDESTRRL